MIDYKVIPQKGDIWTASGLGNGQLVYKILKLKNNKVKSCDYNRNFKEGTQMVKYQIRDTKGALIVRITSLYTFLKIPVTTSGTRSFRKLAVRPL